MNLLNNLNNIKQEIKVREKTCKIDHYNQGTKVHKKQLLFHKNGCRNRWVFGGNRSGKTECGAIEAIWWARGIHPFRKNRENVHGWVVSVSYEVQRDVAQEKILNYLKPEWIYDIIMMTGKKGSPKNGIIDYIVIKNVFGGLSTIGFKSFDQGREKFQGASLDFVWFDEEPPKDIYDECRMRVLDRCGDVWGTMTPLKGLTFIYDEIYLNSSNSDQIWHIHMEWADNPFLDKNEIKMLADSMSDDEINSRRFGKFSNAEGLVYSEFDQNVHIVEPFNVPVEWYDNISIDPGLRNPLSCHFYARDFDDNIYVIAEHYEAERDIDYHANEIKRIAKDLNWHTDSRGRICALIDSAATQRTLASAKSVSEMFYDRDIVVNTKVNKDLFTGIAKIKVLLKQKKLFIFKNCTNLIREIKSYWWGKGDNPQKKDDHALDEMRYYVMYNALRFKKDSCKQSLIERDKRRLAKRLKG